MVVPAICLFREVSDRKGREYELDRLYRLWKEAAEKPFPWHYCEPGCFCETHAPPEDEEMLGAYVSRNYWPARLHAAAYQYPIGFLKAGDAYVRHLLTNGGFSSYPGRQHSLPPWVYKLLSTDPIHYDRALEVLFLCAPISAGVYAALKERDDFDSADWAAVVGALDEEERWREFRTIRGTPPYAALLDLLCSTSYYSPRMERLCDRVAEGECPARSPRVDALLALRRRARLVSPEPPADLAPW